MREEEGGTQVLTAREELTAAAEVASQKLFSLKLTNPDGLLFL